MSTWRARRRYVSTPVQMTCENAGGSVTMIPMRNSFVSGKPRRICRCVVGEHLGFGDVHILYPAGSPINHAASIHDEPRVFCRRLRVPSVSEHTCPVCGFDGDSDFRPLEYSLLAAAPNSAMTTAC